MGSLQQFSAQQKQFSNFGSKPAVPIRGYSVAPHSRFQYAVVQCKFHTRGLKKIYPVKIPVLRRPRATRATMVIKFVIRPHSLPFTFLSPSRSFLKSSSLSIPLPLSVLSSSTSAAAFATLDQAFRYGPSLHKGQKPFHNRPEITPSTTDHNRPEITPSTTDHNKLSDEEEGAEDNDDLIDKASFARVFHITALRVPSEHCFALESRLRGHLLNWPRIRNIARVPGDEVEDEFKFFLESQTNSNSEDEKDSLVSLNRRIHGKAEGDGEPLSPVLYRDKIARTFNSRGFVKFRNLAKLSRPKRQRMKEEGEERERQREERQRKGIGKNDFAVVEVVGEDEGEDLSGLLGDEFKGMKWKGSTRLLLLDERYAGKGLEQLPEAIKVSLPALS